MLRSEQALAEAHFRMEPVVCRQVNSAEATTAKLAYGSRLVYGALPFQRSPEQRRSRRLEKYRSSPEISGSKQGPGQDELLKGAGMFKLPSASSSAALRNFLGGAEQPSTGITRGQQEAPERVLRDSCCGDLCYMHAAGTAEGRTCSLRCQLVAPVVQQCLQLGQQTVDSVLSRICRCQ